MYKHTNYEWYTYKYGPRGDYEKILGITTENSGRCENNRVTVVQSARGAMGQNTRGDTLYFKDSGAPVTLKGMVTKVLQFEVRYDDEAMDITKRFASGLGFSRIPDVMLNYISGKRYGILVFFDSVEKVKPFNIDKAGFGMMSAWISVPNIRSIKHTDI